MSTTEKDKLIESLKNELEILKSNNNILNTILDYLPHQIYVKDEKSRFMKVNQTMINFLGLTKESEIIGKTDLDFFEKKVADIYFKEEKDIMLTGKQFIGKEHFEIHQNGKITWGRTSKLPLFNKENKIIGTYRITVDLTERKQVETELQESQYRFNKLIENATLGILRLDDNGKIIMANPAYSTDGSQRAYHQYLVHAKLGSVVPPGGEQSANGFYNVLTVHIFGHGVKSRILGDVTARKRCLDNF